MKAISYDKQCEPIVTSKVTFDILLKQDNPGDLIALYHFYYYTAKWQETNKVKSTTAYTAKGLKWSEPRVQKNKKTLKQLGLIEDIKKRNEENQIDGHYIKINFIWHIPHNSNSLINSHTSDSLWGGNSYGMENLGTNTKDYTNTLNALETNKENALRKTNKKMRRTRGKLFSLNGNNSQNKITPNQFDSFWKHYPKKTDKGKAKKAWEKLCTKKDRPTIEQVTEAITAQKESERWQQGYIKLPTTWLNNYGWIDTPDELTSPNYQNKINPTSHRYKNKTKEVYKKSIKV